MKLKMFFCFLIIFSFNSCDILRLSPFEVTSWSPGDGYHSNPEEIEISLTFSHDPERSGVERRFSLTGDSGRVSGLFIWEDKKMIFTPLLPLEKNADYNLNLSTEASDTRGLSMDTAFIGKFTTRPDTERPFLISCYPSLYCEIDNPETEVKLEFSTPLPLTALYDNVSFSPSMTGSWRLEDDGKLAIFTPSESWAYNKRYEVKFSSSLINSMGMNTGNEFISVFTVGTDHESPELLYARRVTKNGAVFPLNRDINGFVSVLESPEESHGWEKDDRLSLLFSKYVDGLSVKNNLSVEDAPSVFMETSPGYKTEFIFYFETSPFYESRFVFRLKPGIKDISGNESVKEYIYRIFANGKFSKPPSLAGIRMPMAPGNQSNQQLEYFDSDSLLKIIPIRDSQGYYPSGEDIKTWIEFYFDTAEGAAINPFSLMELFRVETSNNVLTFSPRQVKTKNFTITSPQAGWENYQRLEITGNLTNSTNYGIISFQISSGLTDSLDNKNENTLRISVVK